MAEPGTHTDQMGRTIVLKHVPLRIVSLVPSQTELLYELGLDDEVVGQTLFCIHPLVQHNKKPRVGGTKKLDIEKIRQLKPDLIIGNKEENDKEQIELLMQEFSVWMSDIHCLDEALEMIVKIGELVNKSAQANSLANEIQLKFRLLENAHTPLLSCVYLIWRKPYMAAGNTTFINDMLMRCGLQNLALPMPSRYPELTAEQIKELNPQVILLSSEPYPFKQKHIDELQSICKTSKILLVDGEMFSWYGSRLLLAGEYFKGMKETERETERESE